MPIKLNISIESPLDPEDRDLLSGIAVMTLAIANHAMAAAAFPDAFPPRDEDLRETLLRKDGKRACAHPTGLLTGSLNDRYCDRQIDHKGRHHFVALGDIIGKPAGRAN